MRRPTRTTGSAGRAAARLALCALVLAVAPGIAKAGPDDATAVAERFCALQAKGDDAALRPMLSTALADLLSEAEERNAIIASGAPDEKPPLGDGIPWRTFPDVTEACAPASVRETDNATLVAVRYRIAGEEAGWKDTLVLRRENGRLAIDDVMYQLFPTDTYRGSLRRFLKDSFDQ
ncbi:MAG: hypothetical protein K5872_04890 [Rhizobiaceae bacterium]|nr:hypothetical protein [Rhizobiaceae bacterium]MCV0405546.1 hypothetical protein [Rhizobiaceae bacterium]